ncbi:uncharacterized protein LOC129305735 [Prosopis cineraria]|uniref:uncharacterized protein LOC129305735 n=1 Tax=Prosopis cineraria TaxID=364024 RepID=UPI00240FE743|nr:uncharacterized protein LOC129305735 [Prosopis cineraria]
MGITTAMNPPLDIFTLYPRHSLLLSASSTSSSTPDVPRGPCPSLAAVTVSVIHPLQPLQPRDIVHRCRERRRIGGVWFSVDHVFSNHSHSQVSDLSCPFVFSLFSTDLLALYQVMRLRETRPRNDRLELELNQSYWFE